MATDDMNKNSSGAQGPFESTRKAFGDTAASFTQQASARAHDYATQGKDRAVEALDNVAGLVGDAAGQVSDRLGEQYGGYIRQAADAVSGLADTLRAKDTDELVEDARNLVRNSPAIAIAAAAAAGFLIARVVKSGLTPPSGGAEEATATAADGPSAPRKPAARKGVAKTTRADAPPPDADAADSLPPAG